MKPKKWKKLLRKDRAEACRRLFKAVYKLEDGDEDPIEYTPEDLAQDLEDLHTGESVPYVDLPDDQLTELARETFGWDEE